MNSQVVKALRECAAHFESMEIPYAVMGGLAVRAYSLPRPTFDVDFTIAIPREDLPTVYAMLEESGYSVGEPYRAGWIDSVGGMSVVKARLYIGDRGVDIDVFLAETEFQISLMARRCKGMVEGSEFWIVSPEDLVLLKLIAARPRDLIDVADILFIQGQLDEEYLRRWAEPLGVLSALEEALRNATGASDRP